MYADLPFADYLRMTRVLAGLGIRKVRITGGEPLLRKGVVEFVRDVAQLRIPMANRSTLPLPPMAICSPTWRGRSRTRVCAA